ncbi:hypothetical protein [Oceanicella sp. SM1341]|uniref:hypothetical protein n=1 Tax=Oceanicella sp. SM1341 TaxID=1548889 RepID=UPI001300AFB6|nr:hypothetical protein [Oceanicella sp. SM1341]
MDRNRPNLFTHAVLALLAVAAILATGQASEGPGSRGRNLVAPADAPAPRV